jgi:hypothetical protein
MLIEIEYEVGASEAELRKLFAAAVDDERLVEAHGIPWLSRGLEPPRRTVRQLRAAALRAFLEDAKRPAGEEVLTLREAAPFLGVTERQLRHDVDQGRYDEHLTETQAGLRALRFEERWRTWRLPRPPIPDPRALEAMVPRRVGPGESYPWQLAGGELQVYRRRRDGERWRETR